MHTPGRVHKPCTPVQSIVFNIHPPIPFVILALLLPSLLVVTQIRGHIAGPPPPPHYGTCLHAYREKNSAFFSVVDSRQILVVPTNTLLRVGALNS